MVKKDLGNKLTCQNCEAKFYDLKKKTPVCPKCDTEYVAVKPRTRRSAVKAVAEPEEVKAVAKEKPANDDEVEVEDDALLDVEVEVDDDSDDEDDSLMEDTSDIGGDEDDMAGVVIAIDNDADPKDV